MRKLFFAFLGAVLLFPINELFTQEQFEGKVVYNIETDDGKQDVVYFSKGDKLRMEVKNMEGAGAMLINLADKKMTILMDEQEMYMEFPFNDDEQEDLADKIEEAKAEGEITKTGETKSINGYACEKWIVKTNNSEVETWMTDELGGFFFYSNPMAQQDSPEWQKTIEYMGMFPMQMKATDSDGNVTNMTVKEVEKTDLPDNMFTPPSGYKKMEMPGFNNMLKGILK